MSLEEKAKMLISAHNMFESFFNRKADMSDLSDAEELLSILDDLLYMKENVKRRAAGD